MVLDTHPNKETYLKAQKALQEAGFQVELGAKTKGMITTFVKQNGKFCAQLVIIEAAGGAFAFRGRTIAKGMAETQAKQFLQKISLVPDESLRNSLKEQGTGAFLYWPEGSDIYAMVGGSPGDIGMTVGAWQKALKVIQTVIG